jgi:hypothetical protein
MKLKSAAKIAIILLMVCSYRTSIAQDTAKAKEDASKAKDATDQAVLLDKVLKEYETRKQKEHDELSAKLNNALSSQVNAWMDASKKDKDSKKGARLQQSWEKLSSIFKIAPSHFEYYLRGYKYSTVKVEVLRTMSMTTAYKGVANIKEDLYVEKYHSPDISDANPYFFTVTTDYTINYEYKGGKFELVSTESTVTGFVNDVPAEIKRPNNLI